MTREEAYEFWRFKYEIAKDFNDPHWRGGEIKDLRRYIDALAIIVKMLEPPMTNYDLLISKTPEELAEWTCQTQFREGDFCPPEHGWQYCQTADGCRECWLGWLKAPVEEVDQ